MDKQRPFAGLGAVHPVAGGCSSLTSECRVFRPSLRAAAAVAGLGAGLPTWPNVVGWTAIPVCVLVVGTRLVVVAQELPNAT